MSQPDVRVDPGDLDDFGNNALRLADEWDATGNYPRKLMEAEDGDPGFPRFGEFAEADALRDSYVAALENVCRNFEELFHLLEGLGDASKEIAENYRDTEQLNGATLQAIESILGESLGTPNSGATP